MVDSSLTQPMTIAILLRLAIVGGIKLDAPAIKGCTECRYFYGL
jgi:hypothetical protein